MKNKFTHNHRFFALFIMFCLLFSGCTPGKASFLRNDDAADMEIVEPEEINSSSDDAAEEYERAKEEEQERRQALYAAIDIDALDGTGGSPWVDSDMKVNIPSAAPEPAEDFHLYANFDWLTTYDIPAGYQSASPFGAVQTQTTKRAQDLLTDASQSGHDIELIQSYYRAILDWDARNALGVEPVRPTVEDIEGIASLAELSEFICDAERSYSVPTFIYMYNQANYVDSEHYVTTIAHDPFTLADAAEYANRSDIGTLYYEAHKDAAKAFFTRLGYTEAEAVEKFDAMIDFEAQLAEVSMTAVDKLDPDIYEDYLNFYQPKELKKLSPKYPLVEFIISQGYGDAEQYMVLEPDEITRLNELYTEENLEAMKAAMQVGYVFAMCQRLDAQAYDTVVALQNKISGTTGRHSDAKIAFDEVRACLTVPMNRAYLDKYDAKEEKAVITALCKKEIAAYRKMLENETWLSEQTRKAAIEKLENISIHAVYPDKWENYDSLDLSGKNYLECVRAIYEFNVALDRSHTNGTVDKELWQYDILEANSYYTQQDNSINIIYGILGDVFYNDDMSTEQIYGGIGAIIGHEISHAFDTKGAHFDKDGNYKNWWTDEDYDAFLARADRLVEYYDNIMVMDGVPVNGANVQTEAIADMAGLKVLLLIAEEQEDFDYDAFFKQFSHIWRRFDIKESEFALIAQDPHPMGYLRTNVSFQQFDEFYDTYGVKPGDTMYLAPSQRINVW